MGACIVYPKFPGVYFFISFFRFLETVELQISLKNYDPQKDKRFSGTVRFGTAPVSPSIQFCTPLPVASLWIQGLLCSMLAVKEQGSWVQCWIARVVQIPPL